MPVATPLQIFGARFTGLLSVQRPWRAVSKLLAIRYMTIQRPNCMKTLRQGSVSMSLSRLLDLAPTPAATRIPLAATRAPWPIVESDHGDPLQQVRCRDGSPHAPTRDKRV